MKRIKNWRVLIEIFFLVLLILSVPISSAFAQTKKIHLKYGATGVRSGFYAHTAVKAGIINKAYPGEIVMTVIETGGYMENLERFRRGSIHLGASSTGAAAASYNGMLEWEGKPDKNLRALWGGFYTPIHFVANAKSGVTKIEDYVRSTFTSNPGTTSGWHIMKFMEALGVTPKIIKPMGESASLDAMKGGAVETWFKAGFKDAMLMELEAAIDMTVISLRPEHFEVAERKHPGIHRSITIPAGIFKSVKADQLSYAYAVTDFIHKDISEDVVYKIVKAIWENRATVVGTVLTLKEGKFDDMIENAKRFRLAIPFHQGAVRFYREIGGIIPPELIPPEMKK
jgi:TRAP transporter TAXI family solute receptor